MGLITNMLETPNLNILIVGRDLEASHPPQITDSEPDFLLLENLFIQHGFNEWARGFQGVYSYKSYIYIIHKNFYVKVTHLCSSFLCVRFRMEKGHLTDLIPNMAQVTALLLQSGTTSSLEEVEAAHESSTNKSLIT